MKYSILFLFSILNLIACDCGPQTKNNQNNHPKNNQPERDNQNDGEKDPVEDKVWKPKGPVFKANVHINSSNDWLNKLGIPFNGKESVVVNAANGGLNGGGGIDGALFGWVDKQLISGFKTWRNGAKMPGGGMVPNPLPTGQFAIFDTPFGWIYLAVGPMASGVSSLEEAKGKVERLYQGILEKAYQDKVKRIVLPAISTAIFAGDGRGFTKEEFIQAIYQAMISAINIFHHTRPGASLQIIVNNWREEVVKEVTNL
jgi:O-acetyl-ADP-ribose deacetylase (regulator of RNase III)